jgi:hypothetical protein
VPWALAEVPHAWTLPSKPVEDLSTTPQTTKLAWILLAALGRVLGELPVPVVLQVLVVPQVQLVGMLPLAGIQQVEETKPLVATHRLVGTQQSEEIGLRVGPPAQLVEVRPPGDVQPLPLIRVLI